MRSAVIMSAADGTVNVESAFPRLGPYVIVRTSGVGGMGRVDLALRTDGESPDICVLKRMHGDSDAPDQQARFEREARIAVRLSHPNIAQSLKVDVIDGELCLAQEYVQGVDLARLMRQAGAQGIPAWAAAHVAREIAAALAHAHDFAGQEIVHRDVTPENIMLAFAGDVKLVDFGISRSRIDGTLTSLGAVVGRRAYLPPEVLSGSKADRRADVFALGVVLWEMLTARRLEELDGAFWNQKVPDPRTYRAEVSPELAAVALRAVAPDPAERYQSATDLRDALAEFVPADKDPREELIALLAFHFNVARAREIVAGQIDEARQTLRRSAAGSARKAARVRGVWIAAVAAGVVLASALAISGQRRGGPVPTAGTQQPPPVTATPIMPRSITPATMKPTGVRPAAAAEIARPPAAPSRTFPSVVSNRDRQADRANVAAENPAPAANPEQILRDAYELFDEGHVAEAQERARRAIAAGAGAPGHLLLGSIYMNRGRLADAERELEAAGRLNPRDVEVSRRLADVRRARQEQGQ